jgi:hypothetical protein
MKKIAFGLLVMALLVPLCRAEAEIGTIDDVPAATLLLPYFEVDLDAPDTTTTLFSVNNASAAPAIAHVVLWTDLSVPTLDFNVYLTGYDVVTFNLRDLFISGTTPATSHNNPGISNVGAFSLVTNPVSGVGPGSASCNPQLPLPPLPVALLTHIQKAHTGQASSVFGGACSGTDQGDNVARGYLTIDNVNFCTLDFPGDAGYFVDGGNGAANNLNQLWGDYFYVDVANQFAQGETLVHVEASQALGVGDYTFYARYSGGEDNREGLASTFASRYVLDYSGWPGGTELAYWRDAKLSIGPFACGTLPNPFPLAQNQIVIFDEEENPEVPETTPFSPPIGQQVLIPFPWEAGRTVVGGPTFPVSNAAGWLYLNLNTSTGGLPAFDPSTQNWVTTVMSAENAFSVGFDAIQLDNVSANPTDIILPVGF